VVTADGVVPEALSSRIRAALGGSVPGVAVAVVQPDGVSVAEGVGVADIATGAAASVGMVCNWFSMTKIVTATSVLRLVDQGALRLDDPVVRYVPAFAALRPTRRGGRITVGDLLSHAGGLANPIPVRWVHPVATPRPDPGAFLAAQLRRHPWVRFDPGRRASYSNLGYLALGQVVAAAAGTSYESYVTDEVLTPLAMTATAFAWTPSLLRDAATAYHPRRDPLRYLLPGWTRGPVTDGFVSLRHFDIDGAAYGGLVGSVVNAARFTQLHLRDGELDGRRIISAASATLMRDVRVPGRRYDVGLGWLRPRHARQAELAYVEHLGGGAGFYNAMRVYPELRLGVVMMGNATRYDHDAISAVVVDHVTGRR
jgi:CubicO group peptidase (beta-lactamase class C family)